MSRAPRGAAAPPSARRIIGRASLLGSLALFFAWLVFLRPGVLGGPAEYVMVTGASMEPTLHGGDLVLSLAGPPYHAGDVVVYRIPAGRDYAGRLVVHRIADGSEQTGFQTKGDNARHSDPWTVAPTDIAGRVALTIPAGGRLLIFLRNPLVLASLAGGFAFVLVVWPSARLRPESDGGPGASIGGRPDEADDGLVRVA